MDVIYLTKMPLNLGKLMMDRDFLKKKIFWKLSMMMILEHLQVLLIGHKIQNLMEAVFGNIKWYFQKILERYKVVM